MLTIHPGLVHGTITAPSSKSVAQRAIAIASLADGASMIRVTEFCDDTRAAMNAASGLGAQIETTTDSIEVRPGESSPQSVIDCGESGLCLRMFSPIAALSHEARELRARGSLLSRSQSMIADALVAMGLSCGTNGGYPPIHLQGPLKGQALTLDGSSTSQLLTGLLIALPLAEGDSRLYVENLVSKPYIELTLELLERAGAQIERTRSLTEFKIPGEQRYGPLDLSVEGDWSQAAFWLVAGALAGEVTVTGLNLSSKQSDRIVLDALERAEVDLRMSHQSVRAMSAGLKAFEIDLTHSPDLFPPLAVLAAAAEGRTRLVGVQRLTNKESDRGATIQSELSKIGAQITLNGNEMLIDGGPLTGGVASAHGDHRIAMALGIGALISEQPVKIQGHEAVAKSYPGFFEDLKQIGAILS